MEIAYNSASSGREVCKLELKQEMAPLAVYTSNSLASKP